MRLFKRKQSEKSSVFGDLLESRREVEEKIVSTPEADERPRKMMESEIILSAQTH
jgi:hypothetical protein